MLMLRKHVVIVGGGWGGVALARKLKSIPKEKIRITLISDDPNFRYSPAMYRAATGHREKETIIPITELTKDISSLNFVKARANNINRPKKIITLEGGKQIHYDYLVVTVGAKTNYFGIPGLQELSYGIKTPHELHRFRSHLHQNLINDNQPDKNYVVVGGGATGVELASALASYMGKVIKRHGLRKHSVNIELIQAAPRLLPESNLAASVAVLNRLRKLGVKVHLRAMVTAETEESLQFNGRSVPTHTVIWTAGTSNNPIFKEHNNHFPLNSKGKVIVDEHLRVDTYTYVIGDNAGTSFSGLAFTAVQDAKFVANDLSKRLKGQLITPVYKPKNPATAIPAGPKWAVFQYKKIVITGIFGAVLRQIADLVGYKDIGGLLNGTKYWIMSSYKEERCSVCKTAIKKEDWATQVSYH